MLHTTGISRLEQEGVSISELRALQNWYVSKSEVEMVMFNIGDVHNVNADQKQPLPPYSGISLMLNADITLSIWH